MAGKKVPSAPGVAPLGHKPLSKVKLEGPKMHHDDHGPKDSVPAKGSNRAIPGEAWEMVYELSPDGKDEPSGMRAFDPRCPDDRPHTNNKVNREDH